MINKSEQAIIQRAKEILAREQGVLEQQIALNTEIKLDLGRIRDYGNFYHGALMMMQALMDNATITYHNEDKVHSEAINRLISQDMRHVEMFLDGAYEIHFVEPVMNKKGKLEKVKAVFAQRKVKYEHVE